MTARADEDIIRIARVVHAANCKLQDLDRDPASALPWPCEDPAVKALLISSVRLARQGVTPERLHENWVRGKLNQGWVYGPVKDRDARTHPCLVPWDELPREQQQKDMLTCAITWALSGQRLRAVS